MKIKMSERIQLLVVVVVVVVPVLVPLQVQQLGLSELKSNGESSVKWLKI